MASSPKQSTTALQNSIETGNTLELNLLHPTRYKQHNPNLGDGIAPIAEIHDLLPRDKVYTNVVRAFEDGDHSFVHIDYHLFERQVAFDIHRYEDGIAVEHWDNLQNTPARRNASGHTMTDGKTQVVDRDKTDANKARAEHFTRTVLIEQDMTSVAAYFDGDRLTQHSPDTQDGVAALLAARRRSEQHGTPARYDHIHKVLGEGNFVLVLSEGALLGAHSAFYDLYRLENDKIVEHWDVTEAIPAEADRKNANGKF